MNNIYKLKIILRKIRNTIFSLALYMKCIGHKNYIKLNHAYLHNVKINIKGYGNKVVFDPNLSLNNSNISLSCNNSEIYLHNIYANNLNILIMDDYCKVDINNGTTINGAELWLTEGKKIEIERDCMFARNIQIRTGDNHAIYKNKQRINKGGDILIKEHVWIGDSVKIMKGVTIESGCIIGHSSIVTKSLETPNSIYAGIPAKIINENIEWKRDKKYRYIDNLENE